MNQKVLFVREMDFLEESREAQKYIYHLARKTPLLLAEHLSRNQRQKVYLKREDAQPIFSFKIRGSYNKIRQLSPDELKRGLITSSAGNHAQGVAMSARAMNSTALIVMPENTPKMKVNAVASLGGEAVMSGYDYDQSREKCLELQKETNRVMIPAFDDPLIVIGNGTISLEIHEQFQELAMGMPDYIFVVIGGGGLISGISSVMKRISPETKIIGVESEGSNSMTQSLEAGHLVRLEEIDTFVDGKAIRSPSQLTYEICRDHVDQIILVSNLEVCQAIQDLYLEDRKVVEPAGAASVAGMKKFFQERKELTEQKVVCVISGANMDFETLSRVLLANPVI